MDRYIKKKKEDNTPDWLINALKGVLILLLCWNINRHFPEGAFITTPQSSKKNTHYLPSIEEISYNQLLSTTKPKIEHFITLGSKEIPYIDPELEVESEAYSTYNMEDFKQLWEDSLMLHYKGYTLNSNKFNALFIQSDSSFIKCENQTDLGACIYPTIKDLKDNFEFWLSIETEEEKTFFTKIKVKQTEEAPLYFNEEATDFWKKLINKDKHKNIDNLTVVKPVFKNHKYLFKWGAWERYVHHSNGSRRVKVSLPQFKEWINQIPYLYEEETFVPFSMSIRIWTRSKRNNSCYISRLNEKVPLIATHECFKSLVHKVEAGDEMSIFIYSKKDFLDRFKQGTINTLPSFIVNNRAIQFSIPIEIIGAPTKPQNTPLELTTSTFSFQLDSSKDQEAIVKMDTKNPKNKTLYDHYAAHKTAKVIHIENFKTIRRVIHKEDVFIQNGDIEKTYTLTEKVFKTETFPEFYDFNILPPLIKFRGLSTVLDKTTYNIKDFNTSKEDLEVFLGDEKVKVLQLVFTVVPQNEKATQYITNNLNRFDIKKRLKTLSPKTSLYFDKFILERQNGEQLLFPLTTALHLK